MSLISAESVFRVVLRPARQETLRFLRQNGREPARGHRGRCDFAMRALCRLVSGHPEVGQEYVKHGFFAHSTPSVDLLSQRSSRGDC